MTRSTAPLSLGRMGLAKGGPGGCIPANRVHTCNDHNAHAHTTVYFYSMQEWYTVLQSWTPPLSIYFHRSEKNALLSHVDIQTFTLWCTQRRYQLTYAWYRRAGGSGYQALVDWGGQTRSLWRSPWCWERSRSCRESKTIPRNTQRDV